MSPWEIFSVYMIIGSTVVVLNVLLRDETEERKQKWEDVLNLVRRLSEHVGSVTAITIVTIFSMVVLFAWPVPIVKKLMSRDS